MWVSEATKQLLLCDAAASRGPHVHAMPCLLQYQHNIVTSTSTL